MDIPSETRSAPREFRTTHWSLVLTAGDQNSPDASAALEKLCRNYWYPLYAFVRRNGCSPEDAEDLTQSFFARLLQKEYLRRADPSKGRFRTFLLCALKHFLADEWDRMRAQKRGEGKPMISIDEIQAEQRYGLEPVDSATPDALYERRWAYTVLESVLSRLGAEFAEAGKADQFEQLKVFIIGDKGEIPFAQASAALGITESAVKSIVHRMRQRYCELTREVVAETVHDPVEVEEEIRHLLTVLSK